jgi:hypothetical protein
VANGVIAVNATAALRAEHGLRTPDALICATALYSGAVVVGNDLRWKQIGGGITYVHIDDVSSGR